MTTLTRDDLELYVTGNYDGDAGVLEAQVAADPAARALLAEEAALEELLRDAGAAASFCPGCDDVLASDRCVTCGAAGHAGGYAIERVLVQNAHGRMYLARDVDGRQVALKELAFVQSPGPDALAAFERETRFLRALEHPAIPRFVASFQEGQGVHTRYYLAQELVVGTSLDARLADHYYDEVEVIDLARQVLGVLVYLQQLSPMIVHRDIKPANLLRRPDGTIALVDFGAAYDQGATVGSTAIGTFGYMPLEQMAGQVDATTDPYALGASLLHLLTRKEPWQMLAAPAWDAVNVSAPLRGFLHRLTAAEPKARFASAAAALAALERAATGASVTPLPTAARAPRRWRNPLLLAAAAVVFAGGTSVVGYAIGTTRAVPSPRVTSFTAPEATPPSVPAPPQPRPRPRLRELMPKGAPIDIDVHEQSGVEVVRDLATRCGVNLVFPDEIQFRTSLRLTQVPCDQALTVLLETYELGYRYLPEGKVIYVLPRRALDEEDLSRALRAERHADLGIDDTLPAGPPVDLDVASAPIQDVLNQIARAAGVNIVIPGEIVTGVTVRAKGARWDAVLRAVLASKDLGYTYRPESKVLRVAPARQIDEEEIMSQAK